LGIYLSSFTVHDVHTRLLLQLLQLAGKEIDKQLYLTDNLYTECAYYPQSKKLIVINNSPKVQTTQVATKEGKHEIKVEPYDTVFVNL